MRIAIIAPGSRGDVQPYIALSKGLQDAGHAVRLITHENFVGLATPFGLDTRSLPGSVQEVMERPDIRALAEKGNFIKLTMATAKEAKKATLGWTRAAIAACEGIELIIAGYGGMFVGLTIAEKLDIPLMQAHLVPFSLTGEFPSVLLPAFAERLPAPLRRATHRLSRQAIWQGARGADNTARQELGLKPAPFFGPFNADRTTRMPILYGYSPALLPKPHDWGAHVHVTGFWFLDAEPDWTPPADLAAFLEAGPAPVYVGFGSMGSQNPEETAQLVLDAVQRSGQRAIVMSSHGLRADRLPDSVFAVGSVPHAWLFPRMAAVVHHGGVGTTAAGIRAGVPSIVTPFFGDQGFWGRRVEQMGIGTAPIPRKQLTPERLAAAIERAVNDGAMRQRAAEIGARVRSEDGVARTVEVVAGLERGTV